LQVKNGPSITGCAEVKGFRPTFRKCNFPERFLSELWNPDLPNENSAIPFLHDFAEIQITAVTAMSLDGGVLVCPGRESNPQQEKAEL
jgi:hypothetical protein